MQEFILQEFILYIQQHLFPFIQNNYLALLAGLVNFLWVYLEYKASIWLWPVGIVLPILYIAVSWDALYLGNILVNVYYFITSIIGWIMWLRQDQGDETANERALPITSASLSVCRIHLAILIPISCVLYLILNGHSSMPILDSISTSVSFLGMFYLSRKHIQHWLCWIVANSLSLIIFYHAEDYITTFVFMINLLVSVLGYFRWKQEITNSHETLQPK